LLMPVCLSHGERRRRIIASIAICECLPYRLVFDEYSYWKLKFDERVVGDGDVHLCSCVNRVTSSGPDYGTHKSLFEKTCACSFSKKRKKSCFMDFQKKR